MNRSMKYALTSFFVWLASPIILSLLVLFISGRYILNSFFIFDLSIPAFLFSGISYSIGKIREDKIRSPAFLAILGIFIWASPAIYFLPSASFYASLGTLQKVMLLFLPAVLLSVIFFILARFSFSLRHNSDDI